MRNLDCNTIYVCRVVSTGTLYNSFFFLFIPQEKSLFTLYSIVKNCSSMSFHKQCLVVNRKFRD